MNRIILLVVLVLGIMATSCNRDDETLPVELNLPSVYVVNISQWCSDMPENLTEQSIWDSFVLDYRVSELNGGSILEHGMCYSTTNMTPTITDTKVYVGTGASAMQFGYSPVLEPGTYYVRAYARNSSGISYSNMVSHTVTGQRVM